MIANMEADGRVTAANNQGEITNTNTACVLYSRVLVRGSVANKYRITDVLIKQVYIFQYHW